MTGRHEQLNTVMFELLVSHANCWC